MKKAISVFLLLVLLCGCSKNNIPAITPTPEQTQTASPTATVTLAPVQTPEIIDNTIKDTNQSFVATVETDILNLRSQASVSAPILDKLKKGDIVQVMSVKDGWCKLHMVVKNEASSSKFTRTNIGYCKVEYLSAVSNIASLYPDAAAYTLTSGSYTAQAFRYFASKQSFGEETIEFYFTDVYIFDKENKLYSIMPLSFAGYADKENFSTDVLTSIFMYDFDSDGKDDCLYQIDFDTHTKRLASSQLQHLRDFGPEGTGVVNLMLYHENTLVNSGFEDHFAFENALSQEDFNSYNLNGFISVFKKLAQS